MDTKKIGIGNVVKVSNPILEKHQKFKDLTGVVRYITDTDDNEFDYVPTVFVDFPYNNKCSFEFLMEELEIIDETNIIKKEEKPKTRRPHKATQDELEANNVPIIPGNNPYATNRIRALKWQFNGHPWLDYKYADTSEHSFVKEYILGNIHRSYEEEYNIRRSVYHRIYSMFDKQRDWARIERQVYNNYRKEIYKNNDINDKNFDITKSASDWRKLLGERKNILKSKFVKDGYYYRLSICGDKFTIVKVSFPTEKDTDAVFERTCNDYAMGNFFTSKKDAKRSIIFQKLKTFFKYNEI